MGFVQNYFYDDPTVQKLPLIRRIAFHPSGKFLYVLFERHSVVQVYELLQGRIVADCLHHFLYCTEKKILAGVDTGGMVETFLCQEEHGSAFQKNRSGRHPWRISLLSGGGSIPNECIGISPGARRIYCMILCLCNILLYSIIRLTMVNFSLG